MNISKTTFLIAVLCWTGCKDRAVTIEESSEEAAIKTTRTKGYSTTKNAYFGDLHIHTSWSFDAFIYNTRTTPDDAYRFGKGEGIPHFIANEIKLKRPLDFMAVTDHAEYMGVMKQMIDPDHPFFNLNLAKSVRSNDRNESLKAFGELGTSIARNEPIKELDVTKIKRTTWQQAVEVANAHYKPGVFTTFPGYEWTSSPSAVNDDNRFARNLHRNVIYKSEQVSDIPFSSFGSQNPEDLWNWMESERKKGIDLLAIPHNGNMSDGLMYAQTMYKGAPMTKEYAQQRMRNEPINEVVQIKGQSMSSPILSPNDEFAAFENYEYTFATGTPPPSKPPNSYVREAYQNGLLIEQGLGLNPFQFGVIGSSDGHNSAGAVEEDNYFGKFGNRDGSPKIRIGATDNSSFLKTRYFSAAGLAGVWAEENTREAIYSSLERKETFATSGTRIKLRFFAGVMIDEQIFSDDDWVKKAYEVGVPMGREMGGLVKAPNFAIWAIKDAEGANLDRVQVIKAWIDDTGEKHEQIHDVAWSDNREMINNQLKHVGNTVNAKNATYTNDIGNVEFKTIWQDPNFDPKQISMYYLRVLEIPTPRWSTYDAKTLGIDVPDDLPISIQERAWSSPIWYHPE